MTPPDPGLTRRQILARGTPRFGKAPWAAALGIHAAAAAILLGVSGPGGPARPVGNAASHPPAWETPHTALLPEPDEAAPAEAVPSRQDPDPRPTRELPADPPLRQPPAMLPELVGSAAASPANTLSGGARLPPGSSRLPDPAPARLASEAKPREPVQAAPEDPPATEAAPPGTTARALAGSNPPPAYPATAVRRGLQGEVRVRIHVDTRGRPTRVDLLRSSGHDILDRSVLETVRNRWRFAPATRHGRPVPGTLEKSFRFVIR